MCSWEDEPTVRVQAQTMAQLVASTEDDETPEAVCLMCGLPVRQCTCPIPRPVPRKEKPDE